MPRGFRKIRTRKVLLLEAGSTDWNPYIHLPVCYYKTTKGRLTWDFALAPQAHQDGITPIFTQARVLGGGSSINAQVYIRGVAADYDDWEQTGCPGWGFRDVLPYFRRAEGNERLADEFHGTDGPLGVSDQRHTHLLSKAFVQACQEFGMPYNADFNGKVQAGAGLYQVTNRYGRRCSAAVAYLGGCAQARQSRRSGQVSRFNASSLRSNEPSVWSAWLPGNASLCQLSKRSCSPPARSTRRSF